MDAPAQRRELRQRLAEQRRALSPAERIAAAQGLRRSLEQLPEYFTDARVAGYWASHGELPLNLVIPPLAGRGQQFLLPVAGRNKHLRFAPWQSGDAVQPNRYGIPEPVAPAELLEPFQLDLVLVPLLGFDRRRFWLANALGVLIACLAVVALCVLIDRNIVAEESLLRRLFLKMGAGTGLD